MPWSRIRADWPEGIARTPDAQHVTSVSGTEIGPVHLLMERRVKTDYQRFPVRF